MTNDQITYERHSRELGRQLDKRAIKDQILENQAELKYKKIQSIEDYIHKLSVKKLNLKTHKRDERMEEIDSPVNSNKTTF
jgi:2-phospho-L-lactate transferase/gluconeogenesis factor (CofD/UPF0052 family)